MKTNSKLKSITLASAVVLLLILISSTAYSTPIKNVLPTEKHFAYVANDGSINNPCNTVSVIDTATNTVTAIVKVGHGALGVAVSPDETKVYVTARKDNAVSVIDTATNKVIDTVPVGRNPFGVAASPEGTKVYVANKDSDDVSVIDTLNNKVTATVNVGKEPVGVAVTPDGSKVYVVNSQSNSISVIDTATNKITATVNVGSYPLGIAVNPNGTKVYVTNRKDNTVSVIETVKNTVIHIVNVGKWPYGVAVSPDGSKVYVTNHNSRNVSIINTATNTVITTLPVGNRPSGVSITSDGTKVYVVNWGKITYRIGTVLGIIFGAYIIVCNVIYYLLTDFSLITGGHVLNINVFSYWSLFSDIQTSLMNYWLFFEGIYTGMLKEANFLHYYIILFLPIMILSLYCLFDLFKKIRWFYTVFPEIMTNYYQCYFPYVTIITESGEIKGQLKDFQDKHFVTLIEKDIFNFLQWDKIERIEFNNISKDKHNISDSFSTNDK